MIISSTALEDVPRAASKRKSDGQPRYDQLCSRLYAKKYKTHKNASLCAPVLSHDKKV